MSDTTRPAEDGSLVPLSERVRWSLLARVAVAVAGLGLWALLPDERAVDEPHLRTTVLAYAAVALVGTLMTRARSRRTALVGIGLGLWADGLVLAWLFHCLSGVNGPVPYLIIAHVAAITLLTSFRSGLRLAVWHCLLTLMVLNLEVERLLPSRAAGTAFITPSVLLYVAGIFGTAMVVAAFAAANERELRRRRYDADVLRGVAVAIDACEDAADILDVLSGFVVDELLAARAASLYFGTDGTIHYCRSVRGVDDAVRGTVPPGPHPFLSRLGDELRTRAYTTLDAETDPWLDKVFPAPRDVVVVPLPPGAWVRGAVLLELPRGLRGRPPKVEQRLVSAVEAAAAHAGHAVQRAALLRALRTQAETDGLTGLPNRQAFERAATAALERALSGLAAAGPALVMVDLDRFKQLNDTHGHLVGDEVLRCAASALASSLRDGDLVARYGGEEFVILLTGVGARDAVVLAERARMAVAACASPVPVTASLGVAAYPADGADVQALLGRADEALYDAKRAGRDQVRLRVPS